MTSSHTATDTLGRPVRVVSIGFARGKSREEIGEVVEAEAARGADIIALPEAWLELERGGETLAGPTISLMSEIARRHRIYVVCPLDRLSGDRRLNSAVLLDRAGEIVCVYDKVYPYWEELEFDPPVHIGREVRVYETDFGRVGMAICYDVNFPAVWQRLADQDAELVIWPSAYTAGTSLQAHTLNHHYYIVSATQRADCLVYDITGEEILYEKSDDLNITRITLDLDRGIYHENFNIEKRDKLLAERGEDVAMEKWLQREQWFVLRAKQPGISARALAREYGLEELRDYLTRSRREIDAMRGGTIQ